MRDDTSVWSDLSPVLATDGSRWLLRLRDDFELVVDPDAVEDGDVVRRVIAPVLVAG